MDAKLKQVESVAAVEDLPTGARFSTEAGPLTVVAYAPGVVRVTFGSGARVDYGLLQQPPSGTSATVGKGDAGWTVAADDDDALAVTVSTGPVALGVARRGVPLVRTVTDQHFRGWPRVPALAQSADGAQAQLSLALGSDERVYGLGEKFGALNKRGQLVVSRVEDALGVNTEHSYKNVPFAWSDGSGSGAGCWGVFVLTTADVTHAIGHAQVSHRTYVVRVDDPLLDVFILAADTPAALIERFVTLTGRAPVPPVWSLGVWLSRAYYRTPDDALAAARTMRERRLPCDVINFDGRAWQDTPTRFRFEFDTKRFDAPAQTIADLKALGYHVCCWEYPYVSVDGPLFADLAARGWLLKDKEGNAYQYRWDPGPFGAVLTPLPTSGILDFTHPGAYAWWRDQHKVLFDMGVDTIKSDFGEQVPADAVASNGDDGRLVHNVYTLLYNRCVFEAAERFGRGPPVIWARSGWTSSQRFPVHWGGDPQTDYEGMAASVRGALCAGLTGIPFFATDVGGFYGAQQPDAELYVRWVQVSVYASHFRFHGIGVREPWGFGDEAESIVRKALEWRYRLIPYIEGLLHVANKTGAPVMRAMVYAFPEDRASHAFELQFMFGDAFLVMPIIRAGGHVTGYLPRGRWYDLAGKAYDGPATVSMTFELDQFPVFVRDGAVVALGPAVQHTGELSADNAIDEVLIAGVPRHAPHLAHHTVTIQAEQTLVRVCGLPRGITKTRSLGGLGAYVDASSNDVVVALK